MRKETLGLVLIGFACLMFGFMTGSTWHSACMESSLKETLRRLDNKEAEEKEKKEYGPPPCVYSEAAQQARRDKKAIEAAMQIEIPYIPYMVPSPPLWKMFDRSIKTDDDILLMEARRLKSFSDEELAKRLKNLSLEELSKLAVADDDTTPQPPPKKN